MEEVDVVVIGSGQGGVPFAVDAAKAGKRVVLFERNRLGGTCVNFGCTPSKAFLASAHNAQRARDAVPLGVHCAVQVDAAAVMRRVNDIRESWRSGVEQKLQHAGVRVVNAEARFTGPRTVRGGDVEVRAPIVMIDTGARSVCPDIDGLAELPYLTNETFFDLEALPRRTIVVGGGYIGLELGQGLQRLGSAVTIVEPSGGLIPREDADVGAVIAQALRDEGIDLRVGLHATCSRRHDAYVVGLADGSEVMGDAILVAAGRMPNTDALDVAASGIELDARGFVVVDEHLRTTCEGVFAIGDVAGQPAFTHVAWEDYRRVKGVLAGEDRRRDDRPLAYAMYTEPQLGRVGMNEAQARAAGRDVRVATLQLADDARGIEWNLTRGFYRLVVDAANGAIIGATLVGYEAGEIVHALIPYVAHALTWRDLGAAVHIHPTFGEALPTLARQLAESSA